MNNTTTRTLTAYAYKKGEQDNGKGNGNTIIPMEITAKSSANGLDATDDNEA
jgi:hypothetical protein